MGAASGASGMVVMRVEEHGEGWWNEMPAVEGVGSARKLRRHGR